MSATSSRNKVPPCARSKVPTLRGPPSILVSVPNSSISSRSGRIVAQLTGINGPFDRRDRKCRRRPTTSLPDPGGPVIRTRLPVGATRSICCRSWFAAGKVEVASRAELQLLVLAPQLGRLDRPLHDQQQPVGFERLFEKIVGPYLD